MRPSNIGQENSSIVSALRRRSGSLIEREREVMAQVIRGRLNKQIAADLGITLATVKVHRSQVTRKMMASSLAEVAFMAEELSSTKNLEINS
jgi:FixJ family two-component response regulator